MAQKSLASMLRAVLFEILQKRPHLIRPLLEMHLNIITISGSGRESSVEIVWKQKDIEKALSSITCLEQLNLCLFVDALDEHEGNHRALLAAVSRFQELCDDRKFRLRLCLSSRPENVFQHAFQACPGFAIHEWTKQDILKYTQIRLEDIADDVTDRFQELFETISEKARGVFIWVRLVLDELLEGWYNGDNISELIDLLSIMPSELEGLYERTLRRSTRFSIEVGRKYKRDAFIMFQIALCTDMPFDLDLFLDIADYCSSGASQDSGLTFKQKLRRLHGRCFGLLKVVSTSNTGDDSQIGDVPTSNSSLEDANEVQFIHQTVKDFFMAKKGFDILLAGLDDVPIENGHTYILQHATTAIIDGASFAPLFFHAHNAEMVSRRSSVSYITRELQGKGEPLQTMINRLLLAEEVSPNLREALRNISNNDLSLLVMSACACLPLSAAECLRSLAHMPRRYAGISLRATIYETDFYDVHDFNGTQEILKGLLETGMDPDSVYTDGETPFATLINAEDATKGDDSSDSISHGFAFADVEHRIKLLSTLVHYGADPNQMIGNFPSPGGFAPGLHLVLSEQCPENLLSALLSFGADVSLPDSEGFIALFYAIAWDERECVRILLWSGARVCHLNALGLCAFAPKLEDFGLNSLYSDFGLFERRCRLFDDLFLETGIEHVESCKYSRSVRGEAA
ncbi:MAG: hypothetical protein Q9165_005112 [Trypethelium subeluteriae]